jgi:hypothetical protein
MQHEYESLQAAEDIPLRHASGKMPHLDLGPASSPMFDPLIHALAALLPAQSLVATATQPLPRMAPQDTMPYDPLSNARASPSAPDGKPKMGRPPLP